MIRMAVCVHTCRNHDCFPCTHLISDPPKHSSTNVTKSLWSHTDPPQQRSYKIRPARSGIFGLPHTLLAYDLVCTPLVRKPQNWSSTATLHFMGSLSSSLLSKTQETETLGQASFIPIYRNHACKDSSSVKTIPTATQSGDVLLLVVSSQQIPAYPFCLVQRTTRCDTTAFISHACSFLD